MEWWQELLLALGLAVVLVSTAWLVVWRPVSTRVRSLARRVRRLPSGERMRLAREISADPELPPLARVALAAAVLYLGLTFDLIPDFIPGLGQLDDAVVLALGVGLMVRRHRFEIVEGHLTAIEARLGEGWAPEKEPPAGRRRSSRLLRLGASRLSRRH
jgi:uncharacterized membrane protein YkvA (DUF1232 family)